MKTLYKFEIKERIEKKKALIQKLIDSGKAYRRDGKKTSRLVCMEMVLKRYERAL
jgi:hypothetical protein